MTQAELQQYLDGLSDQYRLDALYIPRRFTALPESGSVSNDLQLRSRGILRDREPTLEEILTHPAIAIVADPGGGKSFVGRAAIRRIIADGRRVPILAEVKQYRGDLSTLFGVSAHAAVVDPAETVDGVPLSRTFVLDGIDELPTELLERLGAELQELIVHQPLANFVYTARQAFYVANRRLLPHIPAVFQILPLSDEDIEQYCGNGAIDFDDFMEAIRGVDALEEIRNPFVLSVMVDRFRNVGFLSKLRSENLSYMIDRLIQSRPQQNAHRQRRALRMLGVAMETYSRNELTEEEALRVIKEAMRATNDESRELLNELSASILTQTANGLGFQLASYGEYLAAEALEEASLQRVKELAFFDFSTPNDTWLNTISYLVELNPEVKKAFVRQYPLWTISASAATFSDYEKDAIVNGILKDVTSTNQLIADHPRIQVRRLSAFITPATESVLQKDLTSTNDVVLGNALVLLGILERADAAPVAMEVLTDRNRSSGVRLSAILALMNCGGPALVPRLLGLLDQTDPLGINIADLVGTLADETQLGIVLPVILRTNAGLSATYYHFQEFKSREALLAVLRHFIENPDDLNSIRAEGYVEPILRLIPKYWSDDVAQLIVDLIDFIEANHIYPDRDGLFRKLIEIAAVADLQGEVPRKYYERIIARGQAARRQMHYVAQVLADMMRPATANWLIENNEILLIQELAPYLHGQVRELLRPHSNGIIDQRDQAARAYREAEAEEERNRRSAIAVLQDRLRGRRTLGVALGDFAELHQEHWPELPEAFRQWLASEISKQMAQLDLEREIQWRGNSLWEPSTLSLLIAIVDRYELRIEPDCLLVFAAMSADQNVSVNHYRRFGLSDTAMRVLERLLRNPPSSQAFSELIRFVERSRVWSEEIDVALRPTVVDPNYAAYTQIAAFTMIAQHGVDDRFISDVARDGTSEELRRSAFDVLIERQHRPTIERSLARLVQSDEELKQGEIPIPYDSPLDWIAKIRADFALTKLVELRERALRLELSRVTQLLSNTIGKINRRELVRVIRRQLTAAPIGWRRWQQSQALEQERAAGIEEAQLTPFEEVVKKLRTTTSLNRLLVMCEGSTDIPVFDELVGQCGEVPEVIFGDVGGWGALPNKEPNLLLLGAKAVIVVMDGDEGRRLSKQNQPLSDVAEKQTRRLAKYGIEMYVLRRYGIENYFPQAAIERVLRIDLSAYFPVPENMALTERLSRDTKGLAYQFRRWVASKLDLRMPQPRQSLYSKRHNQAVAKFMSLDSDLAGTDLFEIVHAIANRARELQEE